MRKSVMAFHYFLCKNCGCPLEVKTGTTICLDCGHDNLDALNSAYTQAMANYKKELDAVEKPRYYANERARENERNRYSSDLHHVEMPRPDQEIVSWYNGYRAFTFFNGHPIRLALLIVLCIISIILAVLLFRWFIGVIAESL